MSDLANDIRAGNRRGLARGITLAESTRADHREAAVALVEELLPATGNSIRIGISGPPGVGKSTFIEAFGLEIIRQGHRPAILAIDPSSQRSGGSILGDKTRMEELSRAPEAFIRPSPSGGTLGGLARRTREALLLCEAAGFDVIIVETVGVGQSETAVAELVDLFLLLVPPGGGDDLQGIKRGIMELADLVVVNKADGDMAKVARRTASDYGHALHLMRPRWDGDTAKVLLASALEGVGIAEVWEAIVEMATSAHASGYRDRHRADQARAWMWSEIREELMSRLLSTEAIQEAIAKVEEQVVAGEITPASGADAILRQTKFNTNRPIGNPPDPYRGHESVGSAGSPPNPPNPPTGH